MNTSAVMGRFLSTTVFLSSFIFAASASDHAVHLNTKDITALLPCAPPLISKHIDEKGFTSEVRTVYGGYDFLRTDIGDPDRSQI